MVEINNIDPPKWEQRAAEYRAKKAAEELANKAKTNGHSVSVTNGAVTSEDEVVGLEEVPLQRWEDTPKGASLIEATSKAHFTCEMAYNMYTKNSWPKRTSGSEEVSVLCPAPQHNEKNPSCSVNVVKNTWFCNSTKCGRSGDAITIAALNLGYDLNNYKDSLPTIREDIAHKMGWHEGQRTIGNPKPAWLPPQPASTGVIPKPEPAPLPDDKVTTAKAKKARADNKEVDPDADVVYPSIGDWRTKLKSSEPNYLYEFMNDTCHLANPIEYNFYNGLIAIGAVLGRDVWLKGAPRNVYANLFVFFVGPTGAGKSQSEAPIEIQLREVVKYKEDDPFLNGLKFLATPNSEVYLLNQLRKIIENPLTPKTPEVLPVKGLANFSEIRRLINLLNGDAGGKFETVIMDLFDGKDHVSSGSQQSGTVEAITPFLILTASTQLKSVKNLLTQERAESGLWNRFQYAMGPLIKRSFSSDQVVCDTTSSNAELQKIKAFYALNGGEITYSSQDVIRYADEMWEKRGEELKTNDATELLKRLDLHMKKFILIFAANAKMKVITTEIIDQAYEFFDYLVACFEMIGARIGSTREIEMQNSIIGALQRFEKREGKSPTANDLKRNLSKKIGVDDISRILKHLASLNMLREVSTREDTTGSGRITVRYSYVEE